MTYDDLNHDFIGAYCATLENGWRLVIGFYPRYCQRLDGTYYCCGYMSSVSTYDPEGHSCGGMQNAHHYGSPHMYDDSMINEERADLLRLIALNT